MQFNTYYLITLLPDNDFTSYCNSLYWYSAVIFSRLHVTVDRSVMDDVFRCFSLTLEEQTPQITSQCQWYMQLCPELTFAQLLLNRQKMLCSAWSMILNSKQASLFEYFISIMRKRTVPHQFSTSSVFFVWLKGPCKWV